MDIPIRLHFGNLNAANNSDHLFHNISQGTPLYDSHNATLQMLYLSQTTEVSGSTLTPSSTTPVEDVNQYWLPWWQQTIFYILFTIAFVVAAGGNIIVIWIVLAHKRMRTVTNYFLVNLAIADAMISFFNIPFHFMNNLYQNWYFGLAYCKFSFFLATFTISVSVLTFMAIAVDRYIAIIHPLRPRLTMRIVVTVIIIIWSVSFLLALPSLLYCRVYVTSDRTICYHHWPDSQPDGSSKQDLMYNILIMVTNYFLPMLTLGVTYMRIGWELWGSQAIGEVVATQTESVRSKRKVVKMMIAIVVIFAVCWLPTHCYFILVSTMPEITHWQYIHQTYLFIYWLAMSNSMYNPIIYCFMNAKYRQGFFRFFRWCPCQTCRRGQHLLIPERVFYSTVRGSQRADANGSLMQTSTTADMDDRVTSPVGSSTTYRMRPIPSWPRNKNNNNSYNNRHC